MSATFDLNNRVTLTGTLTKFDGRNPHIEISVEAKGDQDQTESWSVEGDITTTPTLQAGSPSLLFKLPGPLAASSPEGVSRDGHRSYSPCRLRQPRRRAEIHRYGEHTAEGTRR